MARSIATVTGIALKPGVSLNRRLYSREHVAGMVRDAQPAIRAGNAVVGVLDGQEALSQLSHHRAEDDSTRIVGRITSLTLDDDGNARYTAALADTEHGRTIASLLDTSDGQPPFLKGVSIRGAWKGTVRKVKGPDGEPVETADGIELFGLDYTKSPGVPGAGVDTFAWSSRSGRTETTERVLITESAEESRVTITEETVPVDEAARLSERLDALRDTFGLVEHRLEDGSCVTCAPVGEAAQPMGKRTSGISGPGGPYADPGYQADKKPRYQLDTKAHAKSAYAYINQAGNAKAYTSAQLKRIKGRIMAALKKFGVKVSAAESWVVDSFSPGEVTASGDGSYSVCLNNGAVCVTVSSYSVDPCDLDVVGMAAMKGACLALGAMDPDMDGDIDVPGADSEDDDGDNDDDMTYRLPGESAPAAAQVTETTTDPAPEPAAVPQEDKEVPAMADTDKPAVETAPAAAPTETATPGAPGVTLTHEQFTALMERLAPAAPAPAAEAAPEPAAAAEETPDIAAIVAAQVAEQMKGILPAAPAEPAGETTEAKIARLVKAGVDEAKQALVASGSVGVGRKGAVRPASAVDAPFGEAAGTTGLTENGQPQGFPDKPWHKYTQEEFNRYGGTLLDHYIMRDRAVTALP